MGYVYAPAAVRYGRVPRLDDYPRLIGYTRDVVPGEGLVGAVIGGSALTGRHSNRSDVDFFVLATPEGLETVQERVRRVIAQAKEWYINLRPSLLDTVVARTELHHLDAGFYQHLQWAARHGGIVGENPLLRIQRQHLRHLQGAKNYVIYKYRSLSGKWTAYPSMPEHEQLDALQTALESPIHVARRVLEAHDCPFEDTKVGVQTAYEARFPEFASQLNGLVAYDLWYTQQLEVHLRSYSHAKYKNVLRALEPCLKTSFYFVRDNLLLLSHKK